MIDRETISELVNQKIEGSGLFVVDINVSASNDIRIYIDSHEGVTVSDCSELSRALEESLNREEQDFNLEVSSPGLSEPLKVMQQYLKNIGRNVEIITTEGLRHEGQLTRLTDNGLVIEEMVKIKGEKKRPVIKAVEKEFDFSMIRSTKVMVSFK